MIFKGLIPQDLEQLIISQHDICGDIFLVGGAIRNTYLCKGVQDFDFIVSHHPGKIAKIIADHFHGDYYVMDEKRGTARALICIQERKFIIDLAKVIGGSINTDLSLRDFTMNAIALRLPISDEILDPMGGLLDINNKCLKPCSQTSFKDDPVRVIRAVRFIQELDFTFDPIYVERIKAASKNLCQISGERKRDEFLTILDNTNSSESIVKLMDYGILENLFPGIALLEKLELDKPHVHNAWEHTCQVVAYCQQLIDLFSGTEAVGKVNPRINQAFRELKKFTTNISNEIKNPIASDRSKKSLLLLAGIFHDVGKGVVKPTIKESRKSFPKHAKVGTMLIRDKAKGMGFSNQETEFLAKIVRYHMELSHAAYTENEIKNVQIHRFIKNVGSAGIPIGLLHLADVLATYEETISEGRWEQAISSVYNIFNAYYFHFEKIIDPPKVINGHDLFEGFNLAPGKIYKKILNLVTEEQVRGKITTKAEAKLFVEKLLSKYGKKEKLK